MECKLKQVKDVHVYAYIYVFLSPFFLPRLSYKILQKQTGHPTMKINFMFVSLFFVFSFEIFKRVEVYHVFKHKQTRTV